MKELIIVSDELREENEFGYFRVVKFTFDGFGGKFTSLVLAGLVSNDIMYRLGYAAWDRNNNLTQNTFMAEVDELFHYTEFLKAVKEKFGVEIPLK